MNMEDRFEISKNNKSGDRIKEIARELNVQEFTIDFHKKNIKTKMNVSSNAEINMLFETATLP